MKAVRLKAFRQPIEYVDTVEPRALGEGEVLIKVEAAGVCFKDILI
jgi:D-arabinose 1-dehydrogenase-like Zn-dependent alcohol dehydrogenase